MNGGIDRLSIRAAATALTLSLKSMADEFRSDDVKYRSILTITEIM